MKWITRSHVHVDRVAGPWLITRFIDNEAEFLFAPTKQIEHIVKETVFLVYEAKKRADQAPGVGQAVVMAIITANGIKQLNQTQISRFEKIYAQKVTPRIKDVEDAVAQLNFDELEK